MAYVVNNSAWLGLELSKKITMRKSILRAFQNFFRPKSFFPRTQEALPRCQSPESPHYLPSIIKIKFLFITFVKQRKLRGFYNQHLKSKVLNKMKIKPLTYPCLSMYKVQANKMLIGAGSSHINNTS